MDAFTPTIDRKRCLTPPKPAAHTSWWTVAEDGEDFRNAAREAAHRLANEPKRKVPDRSHLHELSVGR